MKKKVIFLVLTFVFCIGCFNLGKLFKADVLDNDIKESNSLKNLSSLNTLSMMLETKAGSGEYTLENRSSWPTKDDGYVFNETLSKCENGGTLSWNEETSSVVMKGSISDKCYAYFDIYSPNLTKFIIAKYTGSQGENNIYYHDSSLANGAGDNSYRYSGSSESVNNFICFGSNEETCPNDNLYRIIGVFSEEVKLIKWDYVTSTLLGSDGDFGIYKGGSGSYQGSISDSNNVAGYSWNKENRTTSYNDTGYYNDWSYSELNKTNLNTNFINNIGSKWAKKIESHTWVVGGNTNANIFNSNANTVFTKEVTSPVSQKKVTNTYSDEIGLMYVSDYAYAASQEAWTITLANYSGNDTSGNKIIEENWMYMGLTEWSITRDSENSDKAYYVLNTGSVSSTYVYNNTFPNALAIRPVFYLKSDVEYSSGTGTKSDPIRIKVE